MTDPVLVILDSTYEPAARCIVCASEIGAGEGLTLGYGALYVRLRCPGCMERFRADPQRYLSEHANDCCHDVSGQSPCSEWA